MNGMIGLMQRGQNRVFSAFSSHDVVWCRHNAKVSSDRKFGFEGTFRFVNQAPSFREGVGSLLNFRPVSDNFELYGKEDDDIIDTLAILNDWQTVGDDLINMMKCYGEGHQRGK